MTGLFAASGFAQGMCFEEASREYGVPEPLLRAIAVTESGNNPRAIGRNQGSVDYGLMQINSTHLRKDRLGKWNITKQALLDDPCLNLKVGAWIMAENIRQHGYNWTAVGAYNVGCARLSRAECEKRRNRYAGKVYQALMKIEGQKQTMVASVPVAAIVPAIRTVTFGRSDSERIGEGS